MVNERKERTHHTRSLEDKCPRLRCPCTTGSDRIRVPERFAEGRSRMRSSVSRGVDREEEKGRGSGELLESDASPSTRSSDLIERLVSEDSQEQAVRWKRGEREEKVSFCSRSKDEGRPT